MATLKEKVEEAIALDDRVDPFLVRVTMRGTTAYLQGEVPTTEQYTAAEEAAGDVPEVTSVVNELVVTGEQINLDELTDEPDRPELSGEMITWGMTERRLGDFETEEPEATGVEGEAAGGPVGGDEGEPQRPQDLALTGPLAVEAAGLALNNQLCPHCGTTLTWSIDMLECPECGPGEELPFGEPAAPGDRTEDYEGEEVLPEPGEEPAGTR